MDDSRPLVLDVCGTHSACVDFCYTQNDALYAFTVLAPDPTGELRELLLSAPTNAAIRLLRAVRREVDGLDE